MRSCAVRVLAVITLLIAPAVVLQAQNVTVNGTNSFASLDGGPDDADHIVNGVFTVNGDLIVNGTINCNDDGAGANSACPMQFVAGGNLVLNAGSQIFAENRTKTGNGGSISFLVGGSATLHGTSGVLAGALISSAKTNGGNPAAGGDITFNAGGTFSQESGSIVSSAANDASAGAISITSAGQASVAGSLFAGPSRTQTSTIYTAGILSGGGGHVVGGAISVRSNSTSEPAVVVTSTGIIASQGSDGGGNTVALQGCNVQVNGLVAAITHKSDNARIVIRSGTTVTVDGSNLGGAGIHLGKLRGDSYGDGAATNRVDVFAAKDITLLGPSALSGLFLVSANPSDKGDGGTIRVISTDGTVTATQNAFSATGTNKDQNGGSINVSAKGNITLTGASLIAAGGTTGSNQGGGHIAVRSYSGALNWQSGVGDVRPVGSGSGLPAGEQGTIALGYCTTLSTSGTSFPTQGSPVGTFPTTTQSCSPAAPSLPSGEVLPICNQPPTANNTSATTNEDNSVTITMTASDPNGDPLTFSIVTPPAHGNLGPIFNQTPTSAQVTYTPNANYNGGDSFTFQASDGNGGTSNGTVTITVNPVNDPPTFNLGANPVTSNEDAGPQTIPNYASSISPGPTADESSQTVTFTVTNDNNALFSVQPAISSSGTLTYTSAPNANGSANVMVVAHDSGGTANGGNDTSTTHNFNIVVNAVNDAPSFTPGSNVTVLDTDGPYSAGWATSISAGPPDESGQTLNFIVNNDNNSLFSAQPAISAGGVLTFTPIAGQSGVATVTVQLHDNGGTANGGVDTSAAVTFTITVDKVPVITSANSTTFVVGTFGTFTVTASAHPAADIFESGALPTGVSYVNNGSNSGTLSGTPAVGTGGVYNITFTATNTRGSSAPQNFTLTVNEAPSVGTNPSDQTVCAGSMATFTASAATGYPAPTVQWQVSTDGGATFSNIGGATSTTYSFTASLADNGHKYRAVFTNGSGSATTTAATLTVNTAPVVTTNPASQTVCAGSNATFIAAATSSPAATVQWQVSTDNGSTWNDIAGATSTSYSFATVAADNGKQYRAVFTNSCGSTPTSAALLTVDTLPVVTTNPLSQTVCAGTTATFTAAATSNASDHTVQWQISSDGGTTWSNIAGATSTTLSFTASAGDNGKQYRAIFTDACGSSSSTAATLTVDTLPVVSVQPSNTAVCSGSTASFTSTATSNASDHTVQWQVSSDGGSTWSNISGATATTLSFTASASDNGNQYRAVFTDACGSTNSNAATLTVNSPPTVTGNPANATVCENTIASFTASASSSPAASMQWQVSTDGGTTWNNVAGATSTTYSFTATAGDSGNQYRAVFTNACGSATTTAATLTVDTQPVVTTNPSNTSVQAGSTASFTAAASGTPSPSVQWQVSTDGGTTFSDIAGATSTTYSFTAQTADNGKQYRAVFTNSCGSATTTAATLTVTCATITVSRTGGGSFPAGTYNTAYTGESVTASGGSGSYTFAITAGALPTGVALSSAGAISGTPTATGTFTFTVTATDTMTNCTGSQSFSIAIRPSAAPDSYSNLVNNTEAVVSGGSTSAPATPYVVLTGSLLANDQPGGGVTAVPGTFTTTQGGSVTIAADGTFKYTPPVTASPLSSDTFTYTAASDSGGTGTPAASNGTATLNLSNRVWYVKNDGANGNGQSQSPFNTLVGAQTASTPSDIIFVYNGDGTTTGQNAGITLQTNQQLIGEGVALIVNGNTLVAAGTKPQITNPGGSAVLTDSGNTIRGLTVTGANFGILANTKTGLTVDTVTVQNNTIDGLSLGTMSGTVNVTNTTITGNTNGLNVFNGTGTVNIDNTNTITNNSNSSVGVSSRPAGAGNVNIGATINDTGFMLIATNAGGSISFTGSQTLNTNGVTAIQMSNNTGATINFSGTLNVTTQNLSAISATGGGTLNVSGTANVTTTGSGPGININGVTPGASGITFTSVTTTGASTGVALASLGSGNVAIHGGNIDGGTTGISMNTLGAATLTLSGLTIGGTTAPTTAISGSSFGTLAIGSNVSIRGVTALSLATGTVSGTFTSVSSTGGTNGVSLSGVNGTFGTTGGTLSGASGATFLASGGSPTVAWGGNITSTGSGSGVSLSQSSGSYSFTGTNSLGGAAGVLIANGESGSVSFSSGTSITASGTAFQVDGSVAAVTAAITYGGTINKTSAGRMIDVNRLNAPGSLSMSHSPAATGDLTENNAGATGISITNSSSTSITIANASVTVTNTAAAFTSSGNSGTINLQGAAFTATGNKSAMVISGGGTINVSSGAAVSTINSSTATAVAIDGTTTAFTGTLTLSSVSITGGSGGSVSLTNSILGGTGSTISGTGSGLVLSGVALASGAGMASVSSSGGANGISLTNVTGGPYTISGGSLSGNTGSSFLVSGGNSSFTYNGNASQTNAQRIVNISAITGGAITLGGNVTGASSATGVSIGGTAGTVTLSGIISLNGTNDTFTATDSGGLTLVVSGSSNTIGSTAAPTGPAVTISNVTIGAANVNFQKVSATGGVNAIVLSNTGALGHFAIAGDGTNTNNASGGTMQNQTGDAVLLTSTRGPIFRQISIQRSTHNGIKGTGVIDFTLTNSTINDSGLSGNGAAIVGTVDDSNINFGTHSAGTENNLSGTVTITNNTLTNAFYNGIFIYNFAGTISNAAVSNNTITSSTTTANSLSSGISWIAFGSAGGVASITKATVDSNNIQHFPQGAGIAIQCGNSTSSGAPSGTYGDNTDATNVNAIRITNNIITGGSVQMNTDAILATIGGTGNGNFFIDSNGSVATPLGNTNGHVIAVQIAGTGTLRTTINNNRIVANNIVGSRGIVVAETNQFTTADAPTLLAFVTNNVTSATSGCGIFLENAKSNGTMKATVTGNNVGKETQTVAEGAIQVWSGDSSATTNVHTTVCLTINGNTATGGTNATLTQTAPGIGIRLQADSLPSNNTFDFNINGLTPNNATVAQMESYVGSQNPGSNCGTFGTCNGGGAYGITNVNGYGNTCTGGF